MFLTRKWDVKVVGAHPLFCKIKINDLSRIISNPQLSHPSLKNPNFVA